MNGNYPHRVTGTCQAQDAIGQQLNAFDLLALYHVSRGESIRNVDSDTLNKLLSQGLLVETPSGIQLTPLYEEMKFRAGINDRTDGTDTPANDTVNARTLSIFLDVSIITIKRDLAVMQSLGIIKRVGSDKTGHWEIKDKHNQ